MVAQSATLLEGQRQTLRALQVFTMHLLQIHTSRGLASKMLPCTTSTALLNSPLTTRTLFSAEH